MRRKCRTDDISGGYIEDVFKNSYIEFESEDYFRYDKTKYLGIFYRSEHLKKQGNDLRVHELLYVLKEEDDSVPDSVLVDFHTQVLTFARSNAFENKLKEEFNIYEVLSQKSMPIIFSNKFRDAAGVGTLRLIEDLYRLLNEKYKNE